MAKLSVKNVPDELYAALRQQARRNGRSISAEVVALLAGSVATATELEARRQFLRRVQKLRSKRPLARGHSPTTEELLRQDRERLAPE